MKDVAEVKKNPILNNLVEKYLEKYPEKRRPKEEYELLDKQNVITAETLVVSGPGAPAPAADNIRPAAAPVAPFFAAPAPPLFAAPVPVSHPFPPVAPVRQNRLRVQRRGRDPDYVPSESAESSEEEEDMDSDLSSESESGNSENMAESVQESEENKEEVKGKQCDFCAENTVRAGDGGSAQGCVLCGSQGCDRCISKGMLTELSKHKVTAIPEASLNGNKFEQDILIRHLGRKNVAVPKLYSTMIKEVIRKKYTYKNGISFLRSVTSPRC